MPRPSREVNNDRLGMLHGMTTSSINVSDSETPTPPNPIHEADLRAAHSFTGSHKIPIREEDLKRARRRKSEAVEDTARSSHDRKKRFRFKKRKRDSSSSRAHHERSRKRHHQSPLEDDPSLYDDTHIPNAASWRYKPDPDAAFRESLFDAMADDEGAAFWEGVYGQPIHEFPRPGEVAAKTGLDAMTDDEYVEYVKSKMWEKTHQHVVEERKLREEAKARAKERKERERREWEEEERAERARRRERKEKKERQKGREGWRVYVEGWEKILKGGEEETHEVEIPWPVHSGRVKDVDKEEVEAFMRAAPLGEGKTVLDTLKVERVKWHPDKAQQRWGERLREEQVKGITGVFQIVDSMFAGLKK